MFSRIAIAAITAFLFVVPAPGAAAQSDPGAATAAVRETLANGMNVIVLPNKLAPVATTVVFYKVGFDDDTQPGIAHATEHMLFRGTQDVSAGQFADIAARAGAEYNALTSNEFTMYYFKLPAAYAGVALRLEADRMHHAAISQAAWQTERPAIQQEIRAQQSLPGFAIGQKLKEAFFKGTPFATAGGGTIASFASMRAADIRAFYHKWYQPSNATVIVAGDVDPVKILAQIHALFGSQANTASPAHAPIDVPVLTTATIQDSMDFPVGFGALAYRLPGKNDPDYAASQVLTTALKNGRGAFADVVAQGKALAVFNVASAFPEAGASFVVAIPIQGQTPQAAQALVSGVLESYRSDGVPADLIEAAKTSLLSQQAFRQASISGLAFEWAQAVADAKPGPDDVYAGIARVTKADVDRVLRAYFSPQHQLSVVIVPKPSSHMPKIEAGAGAENVRFTPAVHEPLPRWAQAALAARLQIPAADTATLYTRLPNGVRVTVRRETTSPTIAVSGVIRTDPQLYAPKGKDGVSMLVEALLGWGTTSYDRKAYQAQLDAIAADATLGTGFGLKVQSKDFDRGMALLADGMLHPAFAPAAFGVVKNNIMQSVAASNKLPRTKADLAERLALYPPGDPRRRDVTETTVGAIAPADVQKYYAFAYRPDETSIAIVGDVTPKQAVAVVEKYFGAWKSTGPAPTFAYPQLKARNTKSQTVTVKSGVSEQSEVTLKQIFKMTRADRDYVPLQLANTILSGEGTGSLLFSNLRTRYGYVYGVQSDLSVHRNDAEFTISFSSAPRDVDRANAAALAILRDLQRRPLPAVEVQRAKALLLAQRVLPLDSYDGVAEDILSGAREGYAPGNDRWFWTAMLETTPAQLQRAMQRIDTRRFLRVIVAPDK